MENPKRRPQMIKTFKKIMRWIVQADRIEARIKAEKIERNNKRKERMFKFIQRRDK